MVEALGKVPIHGRRDVVPVRPRQPKGTPRMETWRNRLLRQYVESGCEGCLIWYLPPWTGSVLRDTPRGDRLIARYGDYFVASQRCDAESR